MCRVTSPCGDETCHCKDEGELVRILSGEHKHDIVQHEDHYDVVLNGRLHHINEDHFDYHGIYDPSKNKPVSGYMKRIRMLM